MIYTYIYTTHKNRNIGDGGSYRFTIILGTL